MAQCLFSEGQGKSLRELNWHLEFKKNVYFGLDFSVLLRRTDLEIGKRQ
jgi:hypothetical protein